MKKQQFDAERGLDCDAVFFDLSLELLPINSEACSSPGDIAASLDKGRRYGLFFKVSERILKAR